MDRENTIILVKELFIYLQVCSAVKSRRSNKVVTK